MDPESKKLLEDTHALVEENNKILHSMRRSLRFQHVLSILYWVIILGSAFGAYYFLQPYLQKIMVLYNGAGNVLNNLKQFGGQ
jgi:hypothetical protein